MDNNPIYFKIVQISPSTNEALALLNQHLAVVVAQLLKQLLQTPEICGSNPVTSNF